MEKVWLYAAIGGFTPAIVWLIFWINEDKCEPEPKRMILKTFLFGAFSAFFAVFIELLISQAQIVQNHKVFLFALTEEIVKFMAFFFAVFGSKWDNEKSDPILYMITAALGFAAVENMYYIIDYISNNQYIQTLLDGSYRFIGATLLHVVSSATVGFLITFMYHKKLLVRLLFAVLGIVLATFIHYGFNVLVMNENVIFQEIAFVSSWVFTIFFLAIFEIFDTKCEV
ncbi:hypothetical protein CSB11_01130 [Candidatus Campbellbacteria bacterium]|nr:MAG: hypothetical protein CSB11_01130 [Candidatus Campbellbacteria bacterium]